MKSIITGKFGLVFWFHLFITALAWVAPFLFSWYIMIPIYGIIVLQFIVFGTCLLNQHHALTGEEDATFYSHVFELMGFQPNRAQVKFWVRRVLYLFLAAVTLLWQLVLKHEALMF